MTKPPYFQNESTIRFEKYLMFFSAPRHSITTLNIKPEHCYLLSVTNKPFMLGVVALFIPLMLKWTETCFAKSFIVLYFIDSPTMDNRIKVRCCPWVTKSGLLTPPCRLSWCRSPSTEQPSGANLLKLIFLLIEAWTK